MYRSGTPEPYRREKGSGKTKCITLEANVRPVHFLGREESEPFKSKMRKVRNFNASHLRLMIWLIFIDKMGNNCSLSGLSYQLRPSPKPTAWSPVTIIKLLPCCCLQYPHLQPLQTQCSVFYFQWERGYQEASTSTCKTYVQYHAL